MLDRKLSVAPMMGRTDRHFRFLLRKLAPNALLYSEMVAVNALIHGEPDRYLRHRDDLPCALQLGGSDPQSLASCARLGEEQGYSEINLNLGCPSSRVRSGRMGASLMHSPHLVAECLAAMRSAVSVPVTVKCRTGVDQCDSYAFFSDFIHCLAESGCTVFIVHARTALLDKLSPRANRTVPPLQYDYVYRLKEENPGLTIVVNGGITTPRQVTDALAVVDGVMIGREAYRNPLFVGELDRALHDDHEAAPDRYTIVRAYLTYIDEETASGTPLGLMVRHIPGLLRGLPGARACRRALAEACTGPERSLQRVADALDALFGPELRQLRC